MSNIITGKVISVLDGLRIVINRGSADHVTQNCRFLVYRLGEELTDPDTGESLGRLELVCGEGVVEHIQERMTTLKTAKKEPKEGATKVIKRSGNSSIYNLLHMDPYPRQETEEIYQPEMVPQPFYDVDTDCFVRQIP